MVAKGKGEVVTRVRQLQFRFPSFLLMFDYGLHEELLLPKKLSTRVKVKVVTQVCQLQFRFPCIPPMFDLDKLTGNIYLAHRAPIKNRFAYKCNFALDQIFMYPTDVGIRQVNRKYLSCRPFQTKCKKYSPFC